MATKDSQIAQAVKHWLQAYETGDTSVIQPGDVRKVAEAVTEVEQRDKEAEKKKSK